MSDKYTISFSGKEVSCLGRTYPLGQLFLDFLELDFSEYETERLNIQGIINENNQEVMKQFTELTAKELKKGYKGLAYELLDISGENSLEQKYTVYAIYKALLSVDHKYFEVLDYPSISKLNYKELLSVFDLVSLQKRYQQIMKNCLLKDGSDLTAIQRFGNNKEMIGGKAELVFEVSDGIMYEVFMASDISSLLYIEFMKMIQNNASVSVCENCGKYFIPKGNYDMKYCEREVNGEKVCQKIGAVKSFKDKVKNNPVYNEYEKVYKRFYARKRKGLVTQNQFDDWVKKASKLKKDALKGILSYDDFKQLIADI
ncbi:MAG: hypothetical protein IKW64_03140 [Clostridia bacterium]|nr:hypothetical protein [Clostridia bacterium]